MNAKVINIREWKRPRKPNEPYCAIPMRVKLRSGWGYWDLRGGCFRRLTEDKDRFARLDDREVWDRLHFEEGCIGMEMHRRGYGPADEYQARRYGPDRLAREIMKQ